VTERKEERVVPLEDAAPWIRDEIRFQRIAPLREQYVATLRTEAKIDYSEGQAPVVSTAPQPGN